MDLILFESLPWGIHHSDLIQVIILLKGTFSPSCSGLSTLKISGCTAKTKKQTKNQTKTKTKTNKQKVSSVCLELSKQVEEDRVRVGYNCKDTFLMRSVAILEQPIHSECVKEEVLFACPTLWRGLMGDLSNCTSY